MKKQWNGPILLACVALWLNVLAVSIVRADNPRERRLQTQSADLRWKLKQGQKFRIEFDQDLTQTMDIGGGEQEIPMHYTMFMSWTVDEVHENEFKMTQTIDRIKLSMSSFMGDVDFDSDKKDEAEGLAAQIAKGMEPLVGLKILQTMNQCGKSVKFEMDSSVLKDLSNNPLTSQFASEEMFKNLVGHSACVFPEAGVEIGKSWNDEFTIPNQMGTTTTTGKYTYEGSENVEGRSLDKISVVSTIAMTPSENSPMEVDISEQDNKGVIYFDNEEGRITKSAMDMSMTMTITTMGQEIKVTNKGKSTFTIKLDDGSSDTTPDTETTANKSVDKPAKSTPKEK